MCGRCVRKVRGLTLKPRAKWRRDPLIDAIVWEDERAELCVECERTYRVVLNVRSQQFMGEPPSAEFFMQYEQFRRDVPGWIGFRRRSLTKAQEQALRPVAGRAHDEILDDD